MARSRSRAHTARVHNYLRGGQTNYLVDQAAGAAVRAAFPDISLTLLAGQTYAQGVARHLTGLGVRQFLELGVGMPLGPYLHETVQSLADDTSTLYVDNDPIALAYGESLLTGRGSALSGCLEADVRDPGALLTAVQRHGGIGLERPVALFVHGLLDFITDEEDPYGIVQVLLDGLPPGSYLSVTHHAADLVPDAAAALVRAYQEHGIRFQPRTREQVERFLNGLDAGTGLTTAHRWNPGPGRTPSPARDDLVPLYAGVGRRL
ncbi:SAM-dependent methyltransferase [Streptomyces sp. NBRC 110465]|uniref:SAM-dependent methyltransferase n=1 Tax=Streptomyces sp. NBRC 110465 TaxID=1897621 RepID=UPI000934DA24|nr:SAM-dependent methyltransferase [Streptomyces sp. NBRC 110465]